VNARFFVAALAVLPLLSIIACGDDNGPPTVVPVGDAAAPVCAQVPAAQKPLAPIKHVPEGTKIAYCSNPPSSGEHYPIWAAFQEYNAEVPWPYLVHSMEHGAIVLLYKCDAPGCPDVVEGLRKVRDSAAADPLCSGQATPRRIIIMPSKTIPTKVAAAAWGATYQAACFDQTTLETFVRDHYAKTEENFCNPGRVF
jgi:hypothetical protein